MKDKPKKVSRRDFLRWAGVGAASVVTAGSVAALGGCLSSAREEPEAGTKTVFPTVMVNATQTTSGFTPDVELSIEAVQDQVEIFPGKQTLVWRYKGTVTKGDASHLVEIPGSYLGPIIRARKGEKFRVRFTNRIPQSSIIHWHGLHVPEKADGHPRFVIGPGETFVYEFQVDNRAGTYWYHPHPHGNTGPQVYQGMAGLFLISDDEEQGVGFPSGAQDVPLVIQDRTFDANGQLVYLPGGMMDRMQGFLGDQILVNGKPNFNLSVGTRPYRLRLLNGSNSRIYKLAWSDDSPMTVIATDGGLLEKPVQRQYITLAPAQRIELWVDFSKYPTGTKLCLQSLEFSAGASTRGMMGGTSSVPNGAKFDVLTVSVDRAESGSETLPLKLSTFTLPAPEQAINGNKSKRFVLEMERGVWTINRRVFEMTAVAKDEIAKLNTTEAWSFENQIGGMGGGMGGMSLPHPMHVHQLQYRIVKREVAPQGRSDWNTLSAGLVDEGWHDTVLVMPGEKATIVMRFEDYPGLFLYHCHNLEHEDMGMMRNFLIQG